MLPTTWPMLDEAQAPGVNRSQVLSVDARDLRQTCDLWITDPPFGRI